MNNALPTPACRSYSVERAGVGVRFHRHQTRSATPTAAITVCIVSDNRVACDVLTWMLEQLPDVLPIARIEADPALLADANAQVLLLDAELPDSVHLAAAIKNADRDARVIVMDLGPAHEGIYEFVKAGVCGFILKNADFDEFVDTIRQVAGGKTVLPPGMTESLFSRNTTEYDGSRERRTGKDVCVTPREHEVIELIVEGLSNGEIARRLGITSDTVKSHVRSILSKMALHSRLQIAACTLEQHTT